MIVARFFSPLSNKGPYKYKRPPFPFPFLLRDLLNLGGHRHEYFHKISLLLLEICEKIIRVFFSFFPLFPLPSWLFLFFLVGE